MTNDAMSDRPASLLLRRARQFTLCLVIALLCQTVRSQSAQDPPPGKATPQGKVERLASIEITPVRGSSWLQHLGRPMNGNSWITSKGEVNCCKERFHSVENPLESSMGETGLLGPSPVQEEGAAPLDVTLPAGPIASSGTWSEPAAREPAWSTLPRTTYGGPVPSCATIAAVS